jgi:hypothetical protein
MNNSDSHRPRRAALRHPGMRGLAALAAAVSAVALASACATHGPSPRATPPAGTPPATAAAAPADTASPPGPAPASGTAGTPGPGAAAAPGAGVPRCEENQLATGVSRYQVEGGTKAGQQGMIITLTNTGSASCSMHGYPGLGLEDGAHHVLASHTNWGATYFAHDPGPSLIVLAPGQAASASVALSPGTRHTPWATYLEVTPPNDYRHLLITLSYGTGSTSGDLHVTAMARHTTTYRGSPGGCGCRP